MLALGIDLLRWLINAFPDSDNPIECPGVVLIDELDAHLHPEWQRQIGFWLREKFPNIQFIVATHSPFLAQVAESNEENRSDFEEQYLGKNIVLKQMDNGVVAVPDPESVEDLRVDQIYQTELFDMESLYSPKTEEKFKRHEELYQKKTSKKTLSEEEKIEYEQLTLWRENIPMLSDAKERKIEKNLKEIIAQNSNKLKEFS
jgi:predicted ATP-binding protein involved in virulence